MTIDYRVFCDKDGDHGLVEVHYDKDGNILSWSGDFTNPIGFDLKDLEFDLERMASALNKPVLYYADMPEIKGENNG